MIVYVVVSGAGEVLTEPSSFTEAKAALARLSRDTWNERGAGVHIEKRWKQADGSIREAE